MSERERDLVALPRRQFLQRAGALSAGLVAVPLLAACGGAAATATSAPSGGGQATAAGGAATKAPAGGAAATATYTAQELAAVTPVGSPVACKPAAAQQTATKFEGWDYEPPLVQLNIDRFQCINPDIKVNYTPITSAQYREKLVAEFTASANPDGLYVRDDYFAGWVTAGYLQDIEGMPGLDDVYNKLYKLNADAMTYKGKRYGMPYYTDCATFVYNADMLQKAGITAPPKSLQEYEDQALKIQKAGIVKYPLALGLGLTNDFWTDWWSLIYASGAKLFDDQMNPILDKDPAVKAVLTWINKGINETKIIDPASLETATVPRDNFMALQYAFLHIARYDVEAVNNPSRSKAAGKGKLALVPSVDGTNKGTVGWTRQYSLAKNTKVKDQAYKLNYYLGGLDQSGKPYTAKFWFINRGLGFAYKELGDDPDVQAKLKKFADPVEIYSKQIESARTREAITEPWYSEWESGNQKLMQQVFTKQIGIDDCLKGMADSARKLKQQNS
ncbi:MAG TPA: extracellular solute-binding protein [Thermomicrobiales bacterium]|nr:extracellular solute-binding protein [Thermomicrobiales bacterium]